MALDSWHHLVISRNNEGVISQWYNGQLNYVYHDELVVVSDNVPFLLGHWLDGFSDFYTALLVDDLGIWNRTLTTDEVLELYLAPGPILGCTTREVATLIRMQLWTMVHV